MQNYIMESFSRILAAGLVAVVLTGCSTPKMPKNPFKKEQVPVVYKPANVYSVPFLPNSFSRVAVLPVHHDPAMGADIQVLSSVILSELNGKGALEAVPVSSADMTKLSGQSSWNSTDALPPNLFKDIRSLYGADGVLMVDLTSYYAYKPVSIGLRAKITDAISGQVLWSADSVYNAGRSDVQEAALYFQKRKSGTPFPLEDSGSVLQSPRYFTRFAAATLMDTLPSR
jgi:hypothetical protein